ncbi:MAG: DMP19 family protein, partial [Verrucomicrobia bacterium]|nr:DMP19 family protein [Verrucomicrobiota bacterium]
MEPIYQRRQALGFVHLSPTEQVIMAVWSLKAEVNNGGFGQYFANSSGEHAETAAAALQHIGAERTRGLLLRAIAIIGGSPPPGQTDRQLLLSRLPVRALAQLHELDLAFYDKPDDLNALLLA